MSASRHRIGSTEGALLAVAGVLGAALWMALRPQLQPPLPEACLGENAEPTSATAGMVRIAGGRYKAGSEDFRAEEAPIREEAVGPFWIDVHDVTNAQFARFVAATGYMTVAEHSTGGTPPGAMVFAAPASVRDLVDIGQWWKFVPGADWRHPEGPGSSIVHRMQHPVVQIAYADADAFARWAGHRLPSEAQWEFAARGGRDGEAYVWGNDADSDAAPLANVWRGVFPVFNTGSNGFKGTSPVGCFRPNAYGLYDMAGNVWQWTRDPWIADHTTTASPTTEAHVIKGGSFLCATNFCLRYRPAARQPGEAAFGASHIGFRTVVVDDTGNAARQGAH